MVEESDIKYDEVARKLAMVRYIQVLPIDTKTEFPSFEIHASRLKVIFKEQKRELSQVIFESRY